MFPIGSDPNWMDLIKSCITNKTLPTSKKEVRKVRIKAAHFCIGNGILNSHRYDSSYLRCLTLDKASYILVEIHEKVCKNHYGMRSLTFKASR